MKKILVLFVALVTFSFTASAGDDIPIQFNELPKVSIQFIKNNFQEKSVALVKKENDFFDVSYDVIFTNGDKVEFDKKGNWTKVSAAQATFPKGIVPAQITNYVNQKYPNTYIMEIEKTDYKGYEVDLSNGLELKFNKAFKLVSID
ncbi:MAG: hypothetical protein RL662_2266 [Bacteroidota bacterium]|jgi:nitrogen fixation protein